jgi:hypothetical protein
LFWCGIRGAPAGTAPRVYCSSVCVRGAPSFSRPRVVDSMHYIVASGGHSCALRASRVGSCVWVNGERWRHVGLGAEVRAWRGRAIQQRVHVERMHTRTYNRETRAHTRCGSHNSRVLACQQRGARTERTEGVSTHFTARTSTYTHGETHSHMLIHTWGRLGQLLFGHNVGAVTTRKLYRHALGNVPRDVVHGGHASTLHTQNTQIHIQLHMHTRTRAHPHTCTLSGASAGKE